MRFPRIAVVLLGLSLITGAATHADAFDGSRKGFLLGFGLGGSYTDDSFNSHVGLATDFRIGWGVNEQVAVYYENRVAWFRSDLGLADVTYGFSVGLLGASYYFNPAAPSWYLLGSLGTSSLMALFDSDVEGVSGFGISGGGGYEFAPHWGVEGTLNFGRPGGNDSVFSLIVAITGTAY